MLKVWDPDVEVLKDFSNHGNVTERNSFVTFFDGKHVGDKEVSQCRGLTVTTASASTYCAKTEFGLVWL